MLPDFAVRQVRLALLPRLFAPIHGCVKEVSLYKCFFFGYMLNEELEPSLLEIEDVGDAWAKVYGLIGTVDYFLDETQDVPIPNTREILTGLRDHCKDLEPRLRQAMNDGGNMPLTHEERRQISGYMLRFLKEFEHEARDLNIFCVEDVGTHSTSKLLKHAHRNLPSAVVARLDSETKNDLDEAGRCLGFDRPTAAGFHTLRAVERVIIAYVAKVTKGVILKKRPRDWGAYITALKNHGGDAKVIGNLQHIKDHYRNPIIHPEDTLGADDAFSLFNTSISAIIQLDAAIEALP
ncbi:MAG: hypothetical protein QOH70_376 [Blastocatellia bacterium]|jgi:hypothetical protein|nr:hypothetical protein [Blastocatellia bacterium]